MPPTHDLKILEEQHEHAVPFSSANDQPLNIVSLK